MASHRVIVSTTHRNRFACGGIEYGPAPQEYVLTQEQYDALTRRVEAKAPLLVRALSGKAREDEASRLRVELDASKARIAALESELAAAQKAAKRKRADRVDDNAE